jgi:hypothetical protein
MRDNVNRQYHEFGKLVTTVTLRVEAPTIGGQVRDILNTPRQPHDDNEAPIYGGNKGYPPANVQHANERAYAWGV